jgi:anthranilate synthase component II
MPACRLSPMILLIDNYDSFTYNLVQYLGDMGADTVVHRNDKITVAGVLALKPCGIVISPGPSDPDHAGICCDLIKACADKNIPLFGVCLGMQCMGQVFGGNVVRAPAPLHGKVSEIFHDQKSVFAGLPSPFNATRYHSLIVQKSTLPDVLEITAQTSDDLIMGLQHKTAPIHGVQFHPESIATEHGHAMIKNFLDIV